jgi:hypothetical protein
MNGGRAAAEGPCDCELSPRSRRSACAVLSRLVAATRRQGAPATRSAGPIASATLASARPCPLERSARLARAMPTARWDRAAPPRCLAAFARMPAQATPARPAPSAPTCARAGAVCSARRRAPPRRSAAAATSAAPGSARASPRQTVLRRTAPRAPAWGRRARAGNARVRARSAGRGRNFPAGCAHPHAIPATPAGPAHREARA